MQNDYWLKFLNASEPPHLVSGAGLLRFAIAPLPPQPIEQGMVGPALRAEVLINKFEYHIPLFRQEKMFLQQFGVELSRETMGCWVEQAAELLKPVYRSIPEDLQAGNFLVCG